MANILKYDSEIKTGFVIQPWHISQSVDAFTGVEEYDITISGSLTTTGSIELTDDINIKGGIYADNSLGSSGQVLSSTGTGIEWVKDTGLQGTQYIYVQANGTDVENATELQDAYNTAKTMSPSVTNRITVICGNGNYNFSSDFVMDEDFIDLVSLDGNRSIISNGTGTISITANDVFVKGVDVDTKNFTIGNNLNFLRIENCKGGDFSFGGDTTLGSGLPIILSGIFINCEGGNSSFGGGGIASGNFINCKGGARSFAGDYSLNVGIASGLFIDCESNNRSFAGSVGSATGTFLRCKSGDRSFGEIASGTFTNCEGGFRSFGYNGETTSDSKFENCKGGSDSFGGGNLGGIISGTFTNCTSDSLSFGAYKTSSAKFLKCIGGDYSFGGNGGSASGEYIDCRGGFRSFGFDSSGIFLRCNGDARSFGQNSTGTFTNCEGGFRSFGYNGTASGVFRNCQGEGESFGFNGTLSGKLYYCRLTTDTFPTVSSSGITRLCIDGNNDENNQG